MKNERERARERGAKRVHDGFHIACLYSTDSVHVETTRHAMHVICFFIIIIISACLKGNNPQKTESGGYLSSSLWLFSFNNMTLSPPLLFLFLLFAVSSSSSDAAQSLRATTVVRRHRRLESISRNPFTVELIMALYYVNESLEEQFIKAIRDSSSNTNSSSAITAAVQHFCTSVNEQVRTYHNLTPFKFYYQVSP